VQAGGGAARGEDPSQVGLLDEQISGASSVVDDLLLGPAPGVNTVFYFPKNPTKSVGAGEPAEILVGISNNGDEALKVILIQASLNLPYDHRIYVQNFTAQEFGSTIVPSGIQASFPYSFTVNKFLQVSLLALSGHQDVCLSTITLWATGLCFVIGANMPLLPMCWSMRSEGAIAHHWLVFYLSFSHSLFVYLQATE
jgi:hypothetical protein